MSVKEPLYQELDDFLGPTEVESLCPSCEELGITRLLLTKIPFYKEVILMSFSCDRCGYRNNEIKSGTQIQEQGVKITVKIKDKQDLDRQIVKSEYAGISLPEVDLVIPCGSQAGEITNVEGIISRAASSLRDTQDERKRVDVEEASKVEEFLGALDKLFLLETSFTIIVDDPSGNSFVESRVPYQVDPGKIVAHYHRNMEQKKLLGIVPDDSEDDSSDKASTVWESKDDLKNEVMDLPGQCENCGTEVTSHTKVLDIPHFSEVVLMATNCDQCGHRSNEVKTTSGIAEKGLRLSLFVRNKEDLCRDVLKSETCSVEIPELELQCGMAAFSGRFTTAEGVLQAIKNNLAESSMTFLGDSADCEIKKKMENLFASLDEVILGQRPVHLVLDDPAGNSYIQSLVDSVSDDRLEMSYYERTFEQNEELGLNDMKTENY